MGDSLYIDRDDQLAEFCDALAQSSWLGVDTEFLREKTYYPKLCLVQIASEHGIACIDPLKIGDLSPLVKLLAEPDIVKIVHAARQDAEVLLHALNVVLRPIFDTQLAASFCGLGDQIGYAALTAAITGVQLEKAHTRADWSARPLDSDVLAYAADDVRYLETLYNRLRQQLDNADRRAWLDADMALLADESIYSPAPDSAWLRIRGQSRIDDPGTRGALRELAVWRERRAMKKNRPRRWILPDDALMELAGRAPRALDELAGIAGIGGLLKAGRGAELLAAVAAGLDQPVSRPAGAPPTATERDLARRLSKFVRERATQLEISPALLANRKQLEQLAQGERDLPVLSGWRREVIGQELLARVTEELAPATD